VVVHGARALSDLGLWAGTLSFGQTAFFGLSGYAYGVLTLNFGAAYGFTLIALLASLASTAVFAAVLGYFLLFWADQRRISRHRHAFGHAGVRTFHGADRRSGMAYRCRRASTASTAMSGMPPLTLPWFGGNIALFPDIGLYYFVLALLVLTYLGLRIS